MKKPNSEIATFGAGCFWCIEAIFQEVKGVIKVISGYSGGHITDPTYEQVSSGTTGHAESVQILFDPAEVQYLELLAIFWKIHDPTTRNRQGNDIGPQYRSVIFYHNEKQREMAEKSKADLEKANIWNAPIVTEIVAFKGFFPAETYHHNYYHKNPNQVYCQLVIMPKIKKFETIFRNNLKDKKNNKQKE